MQCRNCPKGEIPEYHKFIRTKVQVVETWNEVDKNGQEDDKERNGKQHYNNMSFPAGSMVKEQRENTEENDTTPPLCHTCQTCNYHTRGHSNYLTVSAVKKAVMKKNTAENVTTSLYTVHAKCVTIMLEDIPITSWYLQWRQLQRKKNTARRWHHLTSMPHMPNMWLSYQRTCNCLTVCTSEKAAKKKIRTVSMVQD